MEKDIQARKSPEEARALRARVAELERRLEETRLEHRRRVSVPMSEEESLRSRLRAAETAIEGFFEQPLVMMFIADLVEGRFLRINKRVCQVLGLPEKEILESSFLDRVHPDDLRPTLREMGRLAAGERCLNFQNRHRDSGGVYHVFRWTAVADANRELCYAMAVEVTE
jgi:PAS domain S-box-containing protein